MQFNSRKMIIAVLIVGAMFVLFLTFAFNSIQSVKTEVEFAEGEALSPYLLDISDRLCNKVDNNYIDDVSIRDMKINLILVDHLGESACFIMDGSVKTLNYGTLDTRYIYCNSYFLTTNINKRQTIIINCDELLGEPVARCISLAYHYKYVTTNILSPERVECFITENQDVMVSYYRYCMIESAKEIYYNDLGMDLLHHYYLQYAETLGENEHREAVNYDFYDGLKQYVFVKVLAEDDVDFSLFDYINSFRNNQNIYSKDDEYKVMGLLLCLLLEREGISITENSTSQGDWYILLLKDTPIGDVEVQDLDDYKIKFTKYQEWAADIIDTQKLNLTRLEPTELTLLCEEYDNTIQTDDYYIYVNYTGRRSDLSVIEEDYVAAEISLYSIRYYLGD